ncbi:MAG: NAD(P)H-hydrate dehydratase [Holophagaceae bacterium]|nr:NAD(P)H-hydrate dehydratase [Holophagaceae bacterium]
MIPILTAEEMRTLERLAINSGRVSSLELQEISAQGAVALIPEGVRVDVVVGPGNNGGDALAVARLLNERWQEVRVWALSPDPVWSGDAEVQHQNWLAVGGEIGFTDDPLTEPALRGSVWFVDGMFGLSANRALTGVGKAWTELWSYRRGHCEILALDQPSGLRPDDPDCIESYATRTACFGYLKLCHALMPARAACGEITVVDLGIIYYNPAPGLAGIVPRHWLVDKIQPGSHPWNAHKRDKGNVAIRAGRLGMSGAAVLAALGALRVGAGLVTVLTDADVRAEIACQVPEAMVCVWDGVIPEGTDVLLVGPGGVTEIPEWRGPLVLDASALKDGEGSGWMARPDTIITPHPGEFSRLFRLPKAESTRARLNQSWAMAKGPGVLVMKGAQSITAEAGYLYINDSGHWGLATGGTGDFLAGMVAGLRAQDLSARAAVINATWLHGKAADRIGPGPLLPRDLAEELPKLLRDLHAGRPA